MSTMEGLAQEAEKEILAGRGGLAIEAIKKMLAMHDEILKEEEKTHDTAVDHWMKRKDDMVNALLGIENGMPLLSPEQEVKLAKDMRAKAGLTGTTRLDKPTLIVPPDLTPDEPE